jgi:hypothetical protein
MLPFAEAVERLHLPAHFSEHTFVRYDEADLKVRYFEKSGVIAGDIDLDALCYQDNVAGIFAPSSIGRSTPRRPSLLSAATSNARTSLPAAQTFACAATSRPTA